jgi:predicted ATPase
MEVRRHPNRQDVIFESKSGKTKIYRSRSEASYKSASNHFRLSLTNKKQQKMYLNLFLDPEKWTDYKNGLYSFSYWICHCLKGSEYVKFKKALLKPPTSPKSPLYNMFDSYYKELSEKESISDLERVLSTLVEIKIKTIGFRNFRKFRDESLSLAPINYLIGANSSGKSSCIKAILLFKTNLNDELFPFYINPYRAKLQLGSFNDMLKRDSKDNTIDFIFNEIEFTYCQSKNDNILGFLESIKVGEIKIYFKEGRPTKAMIDSEEVISNNNYSELENKSNFYVDSIEFGDLEERIRYYLVSSLRDVKHHIDRLRREGLELLEEDIARLIEELEDKLEVFENNFIKKKDLAKIFSVIEKNKIKAAYEIINLDNNGIIGFIDLISDLDNTISTYIDDEIRPEIEKIYELDDHLSHSVPKSTDLEMMRYRRRSRGRLRGFNRNGILKSRRITAILIGFGNVLERTDALPAVRAKQDRMISVDSDFGQMLIAFNVNRQTDFRINNFIALWLNKFDLGSDMNIKNHGLGLEVTFNKDSEKVNLADLGYGYTELLPIILQIAVSAQKNHKLLLIEEPESNLHPNYQSQLAELFIHASYIFGLNFIIETHSEYMIRKNQVLVAERKFSYPEKQRIFFFEPDSIYQINFSSDGKMDKKFGAGFFDESHQNAIKLYQINSKSDE